MNFRNLYIAVFVVIPAFLLGSCGVGGSKSELSSNDTIVTDADFLSIIEHGGFTEVRVANPWAVDEILARYALVDRDVKGGDVPDGMIKLNVPLQRSIVYSSVHTSAIDELGAIEKIVGVADAGFFAAENPVARRLMSGDIVDIGQSVSPSIELIIDLQAEAVLLSPWENANLGGVERTGVPLIMMADYLETTPLGRAEWIKFIGRLYGNGAVADSIFDTVKRDYNNLKTLAQRSQLPNPVVLTEKTYAGTWYVPGGQSYMANMLFDAGTIYPWADNVSTGSLPLDEASVIDKAGDAHFWLVKDGTNHSAESFIGMMPHAKAFKSFPEGVYICNVETTPIFLDIAFHPERILADMIKIFHPDVVTDKKLYYYQPLTK